MKDPRAQALYMDFAKVQVPTGRPSDIDMVYIDMKSGFLFVGEIKNAGFNEDVWFDSFQREMLQRFVDGHKDGGMLMLILHDKTWQAGDFEVDISKCFVHKYYFLGKWHQPSFPVTVGEAIKRTLQYENKKTANSTVPNG